MPNAALSLANGNVVTPCLITHTHSNHACPPNPQRMASPIRLQQGKGLPVLCKTQQDCQRHLLWILSHLSPQHWLSTCMLAPQQTTDKKLTSPVVKAILPKIGFCWNMSQQISFSSQAFGGHGLTPLLHYQGVNQTTLFVQHL